MNYQEKLTWRQEMQMMEDSFARSLLIEHNIKEITTQRQAKNGTRVFEFPVPSRRQWPNSERLQLACFKSGYVRNQNSCYSNYQLNKQYKQNVKYTMLNEHNILVDKEYMMNSRALIHNGLTRLKYMLEFYLKNYTNTIL
jgi:hypothetical protein|tara:strand:- start:1623 stop:2042 length:420 start_codon:yes stop_codon:yes gene_type:complete